jgi:hypothetical protein
MFVNLGVCQNGCLYNHNIAFALNPTDENREKFWEPLVNGAVKLSKIWISHLNAPKTKSKP